MPPGNRPKEGYYGAPDKTVRMSGKGASMDVNRAMRRAAGKRLKISDAEDSAYVDYTRGRTGGKVRGPASNMVSGVNGSYKGEGGDVRMRKGQKNG